MSELETWLADRPDSVKRLARRFPPGSTLSTHAGELWVVAYGERPDGSAILEVSDISPLENYDEAVRTRQIVCECCGPSEPA